MGTTTSELIYAYQAPSTCSVDADQAQVALATSGGVDAHPIFFDGIVRHPRQTAQAMLLVARIARTRFYEPPNSAARLAALDPVVTAGEQKLRFESFSGCCGVYARLDLLPASLEDAFCGTGTTNVDFNAPMRQSLGSVSDRTPMRLEVGLDEVAVSAAGGRAVERKVPLPERWVRGFAQVQVDLAATTVRHELDGVAARRFLQSLPSTRSGRELLWAVPSGGSLRLSSRPAPGAVCLAAPSRLKPASDLAQSIRGLRAYGPADLEFSGYRPGSPEPSAWEFLLEDARMWLVLSPEVFRGFSGEGGMLFALALDLPGAHDAAAGRAGFDPAEGDWFDRLLPLDRALLESGHPRLRDANALVGAGAVSFDTGYSSATISTDGAVHTVRFLAPTTCTCPWFAKHRGDRGPCKHVLAATIVRASHERVAPAWPAVT